MRQCNCYICGKTANAAPFNGEQSLNIIQVGCEICGNYLITYEERFGLEKYESFKPRISSVVKERNIHKKSRYLITSKDNSFVETNDLKPISIDRLVKKFPTNISERLDRVLLNIYKLSEIPSQIVQLKLHRDYPIFFSEEIGSHIPTFIINQLAQDGYITKEGSSDDLQILLTVKGWNRVSELEEVNQSNSKQCFVAMWFDSSMNKVYQEAIEPAIERCGYKPLRIDNKEHNERIDAEIITEIDRSKFIIADVTGHRSGVYFEAGYALGRGMTVIWTCKADNLEEVHFDTRQFNHVVWENEEQLREKLYYRIMATIK